MASKTYATDAELFEMIEEIDEYGSGLSDWEVEFIGGLLDGGPSSYTRKQAIQIQRIHKERIPKR